jgi:hypothetical protein
MLDRFIHCEKYRLPTLKDGGMIGFNYIQAKVRYGSSDHPGWGAVF